jgi:hypothetical protein
VEARPIQSNLRNYNRNNNNNNIETGRDISDEILTDDLGYGIFVDEHVVWAFNSAESSIGVECQTSPKFDDSHEDIDERYLSNDPIIISSNEDYITAIKGPPTPLPSEITELFDLSKKSYFDTCVKHVGHKFITNQAKRNPRCLFILCCCQSFPLKLVPSNDKY